MSRPIADLDLSKVPQGTWSYTFLSLIDAMDRRFGADTWTSTQVAVTTAAILLVLKLTLKQKAGVSWWAWVHAVASGYLSWVCVHLSSDIAVELTGTAEPLRSILCQGPLTSLHRIVPAITLGYGLFDIFEGLTLGIDFIMHGVATFSIMLYFCYFHVAELIVPMLLMEISTPHLAMLRYEHFNELALTLNMACFVITFATFRCLYTPYLWYEIMITLKEHDGSEETSCLPWHFTGVVFLFGMFFHCLNYFWMYKIILKVKRKFAGKEKVHQDNTLKSRKDL